MRANSGPWTLAVLTPRAAVASEPSRLAWFLLETAVLVWCGGALWTLYGGDSKRADAGWRLAVSGYAGMLTGYDFTMLDLRVSGVPLGVASSGGDGRVLVRSPARERGRLG